MEDASLSFVSKRFLVKHRLLRRSSLRVAVQFFLLYLLLIKLTFSYKSYSCEYPLLVNLLFLWFFSHYNLSSCLWTLFFVLWSLLSSPYYIYKPLLLLYIGSFFSDIPCFSSFVCDRTFYVRMSFWMGNALSLQSFALWLVALGVGV